MTRTTREIKGFAKHYAIPYQIAEKCWTDAGGNWAKAADLLIAIYKTKYAEQLAAARKERD